MTASDPYGRAIRDFHLGEQDEPLVDRCGDETREHPIERFYFGEFEGDDWLDSWLDGPLLDMGAGVGQHSLYFQERYEAVAVEVSDHLVETMRERGVEDARRGDMLALRDSFDRDRFRSAFAHGTQLGVTGSMDGLRRFLGDLAFVTTPDATAVVDANDPAADRVSETFGYRSDPAPGLAWRVYHFEYEGDASEPLVLRLFGPDRLREAAVGTGWEVAEVRYGSDDGTYYRAALRKR